jgi:hypothetical protein
VPGVKKGKKRKHEQILMSGNDVGLYIRIASWAVYFTGLVEGLPDGGS